MKTREKILQTGRDLFNEAGEATVTVLDISLTLNISPGNLYYHFRSKEDILYQLFDQLYETITPRLEELELSLVGLDQQPLILDALFETMWLYRFVYLDTYRLSQRYPRLKRRLQNLLSHHKMAFSRWVEQLEAADLLSLPTQDHRELLVDNLTTQSVSWIALSLLQYRENPETSRQRAVAQVMSLLTQRFHRGHSQEHHYYAQEQNTQSPARQTNKRLQLS